MTDPMSWAELVRSRRSVRDFRPDPIAEDLLEAVLTEAMGAPSWSNTQPYRLAVASGARAARISAELCRRFDESVLPDSDRPIPLAYPEDLQAPRRAAGHGLYEVLGIDRADRAARTSQLRRNFEFFGAPTAVFVFAHSGLGEYAVLDAGLMLQTMLLSAHARGLGTCAQGALALWSGPVRAEFEVPDQYHLVCGVAVGYASPHAVNEYAPGRKQLAEVLLRPAVTG